MILSNLPGMCETAFFAILNFQFSPESTEEASGYCQYTRLFGCGTHWFLNARSPALSCCVRPMSNMFAPFDFAAAMALQNNHGVAPNLLKRTSEHPYL